MMNGQPGGTIDRIAENAWLKAVERIAVPFLVFIVYQMYGEFAAVRDQMPVVIERVKNLEIRADKMEQRAAAARAERLGQYQSMIVEIAGLKTQMQSLESVMSDQKTILRDINQKLARDPRAP